MQKNLLGDPREMAMTLTRLAGLASQQGKLAEAEQRYRDLLAVQQKMAGNASEATMTKLMTVLRQQGKPDEVIALQKEILASKRRQLGQDNSEVAASLGALASELLAQGKQADAEALLRDWLAAHGTSLPGVGLPKACYELGNALVFQKREREAESYFRAALEMQLELLGGFRPLLCRTALLLAKARPRRGG